MSTGLNMLQLARQHIGEKYENVLVPKNNANWHGPWDCAEFMSWLVFQDAGILYGCINDSANPASADAYTGAWQTDSAKRGIRIPATTAAGIVGGILLRFPPQPGTMGHIVICDGAGGTVEAKGHAFGVVADTVHGRRWDTGVLIPGVYYDTNVAPTPLVQPARLYYLGGLNMDPAVVKTIQQALANYKLSENPDRFLDPGPVDGIFGEKTSAAVYALQNLKGLVADGEVGPQTAAALGIQL
jgi:Putative peptidoglycan binding domain